MNKVHNLTYYFFNVHSNVTFHLLLGLTSGPSLSGFPIKTLHTFLSSPKRFPCLPTHSLVFNHLNIIRRNGQIVKLPSKTHRVRSDFRIYTPLQTNQYQGEGGSSPKVMQSALDLFVHLHAVPRVRMRTAGTLCPPYVFMALCTGNRRNSCNFTIRPITHF